MCETTKSFETSVHGSNFFCRWKNELLANKEFSFFFSKRGKAKIKINYQFNYQLNHRICVSIYNDLENINYPVHLDLNLIDNSPVCAENDNLMESLSVCFKLVVSGQHYCFV